MNFTERDQLLDKFSRLIAVTPPSSFVDIVVYPMWEELRVENYTYLAFSPEFYVSTPESVNVAAYLLARPLEYMPSPLPKAIREHSWYVVLEDGSYATTLVLYSLPESLPEGFILELFPYVVRIHMRVKQISASRAMSYLNRARQRLAMYLTEKRDLRVEFMLSKIENIAAGLERTHLFEMIFTATVRAKTLEELRSIRKEFTQKTNARLIRFMLPSYIQRELYDMKYDIPVFFFETTVVPRIFMDSESYKVFYPFISDSISDHGGIFLGENPYTRQPIIYNVYARSNYNFVILGETGSGKSMAAKVYIRRMLQQYPDAEVYIIDPEGEYSIVADHLGEGFSIITIDPRTELGLDILKLKEKKIIDDLTAAEIIADLYKIPADYSSELRRIVHESPDIETLLKSASERLKTYLNAMLVPPDINFYSGEPITFGSRVIFDLKEIDRVYTRVLATTLISAMLSERLLSSSNVKIFLVDEGWMFRDYPAVMSLLNDIARRGRKRAVNFVFISQRPADVALNEIGRTIMEQSQTVLLLRQNDASIPVLREIYNLLPNEETMILEAAPGEGILRAGNVKTPIRIIPTREDLTIFSTKPKVR